MIFNELQSVSIYFQRRIPRWAKSVELAAIKLKRAERFYLTVKHTVADGPYDIKNEKLSQLSQSAAI